MSKQRSAKSTFIHPLAAVDAGTSIGPGTRIWQFTVVQKGASIGRNGNIGAHCFIERGARIGNHVTVKNGVAVWDGVHLEDGVFVGPCAVFTNDIYPRSQRLPEARRRYQNLKSVIEKTHVQYGATIGADAMILAGVTIGAFATIGLGAVVTKSVPAYAAVAGNPARRVGWMCECGLPLVNAKKSTRQCKVCHKKYCEQNRSLQRID